MSAATLALSFDNLGEAAEIELGAIAPDAPEVGAHRTATETVPRLLERLEAHSLAATFFVEGLNAELYPELLRRIDAEGHEVGFHAWRHEEWSRLRATEQAENLARGIGAFERLGIELAGMRPPGGGLGEGGTGTLREAGLSYCSPAGSGAGVEDGVVLLPFRWRHVDASCLLPPLFAIREEISGSPEQIEPGAFVHHLEREVASLTERGGFAVLVLHPVTFDWLGQERLEEILDLVAEASRGNAIEVATMREIAARVLADPDRFGGAELDTTSWAKG
ncbi:MAG TPA: polysaccharide deacetylase family protein [Solirubrobacterales bacterium]